MTASTAHTVLKQATTMVAIILWLHCVSVAIYWS